VYRTLVVGYGLQDRGDDAVGHHVVQRLRQRLEQPPIAEGNSGLEELGMPLDSIVVTQIIPELATVLLDYERAIFVDAHTKGDAPDLWCFPVFGTASRSMQAHHLTPAALLSLARLLYNKDLTAFVVSVRGHEFGFGQELSQPTSAMIEAAVDAVLDLALPGADHASTG